MSWLTESELRVGLGCMRLSTDDDRDEERALATIAAAVAAGVTVFDTARSYGDNERLLARGRRGGGGGAWGGGGRGVGEGGGRGGGGGARVPGRVGEGGPRRLRGESRGARRA